MADYMAGGMTADTVHTHLYSVFQIEFERIKARRENDQVNAALDPTSEDLTETVITRPAQLLKA
jgi:hypothetical protein